MLAVTLSCPRCHGGWDDLALRVEHHAWCKRSRLKPDGSRRTTYPFETGPARALVVELALHREEDRTSEDQVLRAALESPDGPSSVVDQQAGSLERPLLSCAEVEETTRDLGRVDPVDDLQGADNGQNLGDQPGLGWGLVHRPGPLSGDREALLTLRGLFYRAQLRQPNRPQEVWTRAELREGAVAAQSVASTRLRESRGAA